MRKTKIILVNHQITIWKCKTKTYWIQELIKVKDNQVSKNAAISKMLCPKLIQPKIRKTQRIKRQEKIMQVWQKSK